MSSSDTPASIDERWDFICVHPLSKLLQLLANPSEQGVKGCIKSATTLADTQVPSDAVGIVKGAYPRAVPDDPREHCPGSIEHL